MRTLVFCTSYARSPAMWRLRYRRWFDSVRALPFADTVLIVDDGSPVLPGWSELSIASDDIGWPSMPGGAQRHVLLHFRERLGRKTLLNFPGWYRSYRAGVLFGIEQGFDKIVHLESDAYLLSRKLIDYIAGLDSGWTSLWCPKYHFPELAVQIIAGEALKSAEEFVSQPYDHLIERVHEYHFPLTLVERKFRGDRLGEVADDVPHDYDYVCQVPSQRERSYFWWDIAQSGRSAAEALPAAQPVIAIDFSRRGSSAQHVGTGWHDPEEEFRWMDGVVSEVRLPEFDTNRDLAIRIDLHPHLIAGEIAVQRLFLSMNGRLVDEYEVSDNGVIGVTVSAGLLRAGSDNVLRFVHPDAAAPASFGSSPDVRLLSLAVRAIHVLAIAPTDVDGSTAEADGASADPL